MNNLLLSGDKQALISLSSPCLSLSLSSSLIPLLNAHIVSSSTHFREDEPVELFHGHGIIISFQQQLVCCTFLHPAHVRHGVVVYSQSHQCEIASYVSSA